MDPVAAATNTATARGLPIEILLRVFSHLAPDACCIVLDNATREPTLRVSQHYEACAEDILPTSFPDQPVPRG